ncbi:MAG: polysaccharide deacetylase family protein [Bacteroidales bacterium]|nr:polysaccharide deacetylase family protein [Bacteroidales bacterium]
MRSICFYFQVHQPFRLRTYRFFDIGKNHNYYNDYENEFIARRVADKCYLPMNKLLLDLINEYGSSFKVSFSISGTALDQFEKYTPDVLDSFKQLAGTGCVEFLAETYSHSLSALKSKKEFFTQINEQSKKIEALFGQKPKTFRNTELIYSDEIGAMIAEMGFDTMLTEGAKHVLGWKSPNYMYCNAINPKLKLLLKNFQLSDDIAFRFSQQSWNEWPLTTEKFVDWLNAIDAKQEVVNLFMDYETFGEHQWKETGIFEFMKALPKMVFSKSNYTFNTPAELSKKLQPVSAIYVPHPISWADEERDLTAWLGNELQDEAFDNLYSIEEKVNNCDDEQILKDWRYLQTSDHFYYMCTKWFSDGDVHKYFNPYGTPYEAFINYMNVLSDFKIRVDKNTNTVNKTEKKSSPQIAKPEIKKTVRKKSPLRKKFKSYKFDDIIYLSNSNVKKLFKDVDAKTIAYALKDLDRTLKDKILSNLCKRVLKKYKSIELELPKIKKSETLKSRTLIEKGIKKL